MTFQTDIEKKPVQHLVCHVKEGGNYFVRKMADISSWRKTEGTFVRIFRIKKMVQFWQRPRSQKLPLKDLHPYIDNDKLMRIGSRSMNSAILSFQEKYKIILPPLQIPKNKQEFDEQNKIMPLTKKIMLDCHRRVEHAGTKKSTSCLHQQYHVSNCRNGMIYLIHKCVKCARFRAKAYKQLMGQIPKENANPSPPFWNTTLDYAGSFLHHSMYSTIKTNQFSAQ